MTLRIFASDLRYAARALVRRPGFAIIVGLTLALGVSANTAGIAGIASRFIDHWAYLHVTYPRVYEQDWGRFLRIAGFWPTWCVVAVSVWLNEWQSIPSARRRALLIALVPGVAGIAAEVLKLMLRRERPDAVGGTYAFRAFGDRPFSSAGIGSPSSHAAVAFGAAALLGMLYPRTRWVWLAVAAGCAVTRVLARAHFLSDVVGGAVVGFVIAAWLGHMYLPTTDVDNNE